MLKRFPEWDVDCDRRQALADLDRARVGDASRRDAVTAAAEPRDRRRYDSPVRRQRAAETRERIIAAGAELLHGSPVWNWRALTVARRRRAGRRERAHGLPALRERARAARRGDGAGSKQEAGVDARGPRARRHRATHTARILEYVSSFPLEPRTPDDPTLARRAPAPARGAARRGARPRPTTGPDATAPIAAAMLDVLWSVASYERLVVDWELDPKDAITGATWVIGLVEDAIRAGHVRWRATGEIH